MASPGGLGFWGLPQPAITYRFLVGSDYTPKFKRRIYGDPAEKQVLGGDSRAQG